MENNTLHKALPIIKGVADLGGVAGETEDGLWVWASREIQDTSGDLILVDGIDCTSFHDPENGTSLKVLPQHMSELPDGKPAAVGKVTNYRVATSEYRGQEVKGLAIYFEWLRDKDGQLLPLAAEYKKAVEAGGIDQVSVGIFVKDVEPLKTKGGRYLVKASTLFELSLVTIADNQGASVITKEMEDDEEEEHPMKPMMEALKSQMDQMCSGMAEMKEQMGQVHQMSMSMCVAMGCTMECLGDGEKPVETHSIPTTLASITAGLSSLSQRFEVLESAFVVASESKSQPKSQPKSGSALNDELRKLADKLERTSQYLT